MTIQQLFEELGNKLDRELLTSGMIKNIYLAKIRLVEASMWYSLPRETPKTGVGN